MRCPVQPSFGDPAIQSDPFAAYDALRGEHPVYRDPATGFYVVLDYDLLCQVALDSATYSNSTGVLAVRSGELGAEIKRIQAENNIPTVPTLLVTDPPDHTFYRRLVDKAFSAARVKRLEGYLTGVIDDLVAGFENEPSIDFFARMGNVVPLYVVADLIGADRSRIDDIKRWSDSAAAASDPSVDRQTILHHIRVTCEFQRFIRDQAHRYRASPDDTLLSEVANAEVDGRRLTDPELVSMMQQVFVAGHETTSSTMTGGMLYLIRTPGLEEQLRQRPELIRNFVEEVLRLESPLQGMFRITTRDVELGGVSIPAKSVIVVRWGAGNRDSKQFACPAQLDLERKNPMRHLAFGYGIHFCVGNQLARAELRISFDRLLRRLKNFRLVDGDRSIERLSHYFIYGIRRLDIAFDRIA